MLEEMAPMLHSGRVAYHTLYVEWCGQLCMVSTFKPNWFCNLPDVFLLVSLQLQGTSKEVDFWNEMTSYHSVFASPSGIPLPASMQIVSASTAEKTESWYKKRTFSLLRTRLITTASFSRPCIPSTVPISSCGPYEGRRRELISVTCAWYLSRDVCHSLTKAEAYDDLRGDYRNLWGRHANANLLYEIGINDWSMTVKTAN